MTFCLKIKISTNYTTTLYKLPCCWFVLFGTIGLKILYGCNKVFNAAMEQCWKKQEESCKLTCKVIRPRWGGGWAETRLSTGLRGPRVSGDHNKHVNSRSGRALAVMGPPCNNASIQLCDYVCAPLVLSPPWDTPLPPSSPILSSPLSPRNKARHCVQESPF